MMKTKNRTKYGFWKSLRLAEIVDLWDRENSLTLARERVHAGSYKSRNDQDEYVMMFDQDEMDAASTEFDLGYEIAVQTTAYH